VNQSGQSGGDGGHPEGDQPKARPPSRLRLASRHYAAAAKKKYEVARQYGWKVLQAVGRGFAASLRWIDNHNGLLTAAATVAIAVLTYYVVQFTSEQGKITNRQLAVMEADQRPWIKTDLSFASDLTYSDNRMDVTFHYVLKNVGRSPALSVSGYPKLRPTYLSPFWLPSTGGSWIDLVDPVREIKDFCGDMASKVTQITEMFPWGDIIYPGDTIERDESVSLEISDIKPELPSVNSLNWFNQKPQPTAPVLVLSCIDYQAGVGGKHHQTADYFVLSKKSPPGTFNDVFPLDRKTISKDDLTLRPSVIFGTKYAN
jgi:hypothetical protein